MTVPAVDVIVPIAIVAAGGAFSCADPNWLIAYLNLSRRARRSGNGVGSTPASHLASPAQALELLVEIEFSASQAPGPLRAFHFETAEIGAGRAEPRTGSPPSRDGPAVAGARHVSRGSRRSVSKLSHLT